MSEPKLISPLLDGFVMGDAISDHHGVRCCPAMRTADSARYIVKIISVPASQTKLEALLLAGAFQDREGALAYFKELSQGIVDEAVLLERLSRLEGFLPYERWQVEPMEDGVGYDVYLLAPYRRNLERVLRSGNLTHLAAVNLGLDLCAAMAACRRGGHLYADLRPSNVYITGENEYQVGDLGFLSLSSLPYASLPERYLSAYTAPEVTDAYSTLNTTLDVYAIGRILYQIYNGGALPKAQPGVALDAPIYADPEMARIILKACAPEVRDRWQEPVEMGQALVSYMQANSVNNTPIIPKPEPEEAPAAEPEETPAEQLPMEELPTEEFLAQVDEALVAATEEVLSLEIPAAEAPVEETPVEEAPVEDTPAEETPVEEVPVEETPVEEVPAEEPLAEEVPVEDTPAAEAPVEEVPVAEIPVEEAPAEEVSEEEIPVEETPVEEPDEDLLAAQELEQILEQADELIAHELPEPAVAPEPIDVPIPAPIAPETEEPEEIAEGDMLLSEKPGEHPLQPQEPALEDPDEDIQEDLPAPSHKSRWLLIPVVVLLLAVLGFSLHWLYNNYYIQTIVSMQLSGNEDRLTVSLDTEIDEGLLTVYCTDTYGNTLKKEVDGNVAQFTGLSPNTRYKVYVQISGFHKLTGITEDTYTTTEQTTISDFSAVSGAEDGSVILSFTVQGPESADWIVTYSASGEEEKTLRFPGHMVTVTGLSVNKEYTFRLEPATALYIVGENTVTYTAVKLIYPEDLVIDDFRNNTLHVSWKAPAETAVEFWTVRCYNDAGYDKTIQVTELEAEFGELDPATAYTVEVTAAGMTQGGRTYLSANAVSILNVEANDQTVNQLLLTWEFDGTAPEGGWLVLYSATDYADQQVVRTDTNSAVITPLIPGCEYTFTIQPASGSTVFGGECSYIAPAAPAFSGYMVDASHFVFSMCHTPENPQWGRYDVPAQNYTTTYAPGSKASFAISLNHEYNTSPDQIVTLVVFRDEKGMVVDTMSHSRTWTSMWYQGFGKLDLPALPDADGNYTVEIYYNGALVTTQAFTIVTPPTNG